MSQKVEITETVQKFIESAQAQLTPENLWAMAMGLLTIMPDLLKLLEKKDEFMLKVFLAVLILTGFLAAAAVGLQLMGGSP